MSDRGPTDPQQHTTTRLGVVDAADPNVSAEQRAIEARRANDALREVVAAVAEHFSSAALRAAVVDVALRYTGSIAAAIFRYVTSTGELVLDALHTQSGSIDLDTAPGIEVLRVLVLAADAAGWLAIADGRTTLIHAVRDSVYTWPATRDWHLANGHQALGWVPIMAGARPIGFIGLAFAHAAAKLSDEQDGVVRAVAQQLALAVELERLHESDREVAVSAERHRIAHDVHDTLAQGLAATLMHLRAAELLLPGINAEARRHLDLAATSAAKHLVEARRSVGRLRPVGLAVEPFDVALREVVRSARGDCDVEIAVNVRGGRVRPLPAEVQGDLVRIVQEAVLNACRHANARHIGVEAEFDAASTHVRLHVKDDGRGFDAVTQRITGGYGLAVMRERAERIGAAFTLITEPGRGTQVVVVWRSVKESRREPPAKARPTE